MFSSRPLTSQQPVIQQPAAPLEAAPLPEDALLSPSASLSTRDLIQAFADFMQTDIAFGDATEDTVRAYYREVKQWCGWCFARGLEPARATRRDVEAYRKELKDAGFVVATRVHKLSIVRRFYDAALRHELIEHNPAANVRGGKDLTPPEEKILALTEGALTRLLAALPGGSLVNARDRAIICLMAIHGLRRIEIHRLDHEHIEWPENENRENENRENENRESGAGENKNSGKEPLVWITVSGKGKKQRRIYLRRDTWRALRVYIGEKQKAGLPTSGALFVNFSHRDFGKRLSRTSMNRNVVDRYLSEQALKRVGVSCHALRHTHATEAVRGGVAIEHLRDELGHASIETTSRYVRAVDRFTNNPAHFIGPMVQFGEDEE